MWTRCGETKGVFRGENDEDPTTLHKEHEHHEEHHEKVAEVHKEEAPLFHKMILKKGNGTSIPKKGNTGML